MAGLLERLAVVLAVWSMVSGAVLMPVESIARMDKIGTCADGIGSNQSSNFEQFCTTMRRAGSLSQIKFVSICFSPVLRKGERCLKVRARKLLRTSQLELKSETQGFETDSATICPTEIMSDESCCDKDLCVVMDIETTLRHIFISELGRCRTELSGEHLCPQRMTCPNIIRGTNGDDVLRGTDEQDIIYALDGDDLVYGLGGDDIIYGSQGDDTILGGDGDDYISGGHGDDLVLGNRGRDKLRGGRDSDTLKGGQGGDGDDKIVSGAGEDTIKGGNGDDLIEDLAQSVFINGLEYNLIAGGNGNDSIDALGTGMVITGGAGDDELRQIGYVGNYYVTVTSVDNKVDLGAGDDYARIHLTTDSTINLGDGDDFYSAFNVGGNTLDAGEGDDYVRQSWYDSPFYDKPLYVDLGPGNDKLQHAGSAYSMPGYFEGGDGSDEMNVSTSGGTVNSGDADDHIYVSGFDGRTHARPGEVLAGPGDDYVKIRRPENYPYSLDLGAGDNTLVIGS
ncbi:hypothetical protein NDN08_005315 [Rhodosorus marinus]|uniref:Calcium-binding protein n=1 Tax=Rhodosorus marinus TaxID=101924 RepID=A0AAV8V177_9RHOD|nr:hypothetical protein NDN08_005315 [Rhodosorus marinus]